MTDLENRDDWEKILADGIAKELERMGHALSKIIPKLTGSLDMIPGEELEEHARKLIAALSPALHDIFMQQANQVISALGFASVDWGLVDVAASRWARRYAGELVGGITDVTRKKLQELVPQYFEQQWTQGTLTQQIMDAYTFSRSRAEAIARTEVTRAASEGTQETKRELEAQGIAMVPYWNTRRDGIVCTLCGPLNGLPIRADNETRGEYPPRHPRCRCWVTLKFPESAT